MQLVAAYIYACLTVFVVGFQLALVLGAPWGEFTMGGRYRGALPPRLRMAVLAQAGIVLGLGIVVLDRAGIVELGGHAALPRAIWIVVVFAALGAVLNSITPSPRERWLWGPVTLMLLASSLVVAMN